MTDVAGQDVSSAQGFALPSDHGGKDFGIFLPMANGGWILSTNAPSPRWVLRLQLQSRDAGRTDVFTSYVDGEMARFYGGVTQHWRYSLESQS